MMLGYLLARAGVSVIVLEKWPDFFRDFRGDTIHPSTMELMHELGLLEKFLALPHQKAYELEGVIGGQQITIADFSHLPVRAPFIAFMPQWDFLNFLAQEAAQYPHFMLAMATEAVDLIFEGARVVGVRAKGPEGVYDIRASLVVGADGRHSTVREKSGLTLVEGDSPIDVLWFSLSRKEGDPAHTLGRADSGRMMILIDRNTYWQCGFVIAKGAYEDLKKEELERFQGRVREAAPFLANRVSELDSWDKVHLLRVTIDHLERWHVPGLLCIGDAAHAMSPIGGVGINLAIQDAVAAANILAAPLLEQRVTEADLDRVERRRRLPARAVQVVQSFIQKRVIRRVLEDTDGIAPPFALRLLQRFPVLRRIPARLIGMGLRPEHVGVIPLGLRTRRGDDRRSSDQP